MVIYTLSNPSRFKVHVFVVHVPFPQMTQRPLTDNMLIVELILFGVKECGLRFSVLFQPVALSLLSSFSILVVNSLL